MWRKINSSTLSSPLVSPPMYCTVEHSENRVKVMPLRMGRYSRCLYVIIQTHDFVAFFAPRNLNYFDIVTKQSLLCI